MSTKDKQVVLSALREIEFIWVGREIRKWFFGEIIGWNVCSSSIVRKKFTLERLQEEIVVRQLPLEIIDEDDMLNSFRVYLKEAA